jgi:tetratricopeptide (TPR) repeat protein
MLKKTMSQPTKNPEQLAAQLAEAQSLHQKGDVKAALGGYRAILKRDPQNFAALFFSAMAFAGLEKYGNARRAIRRAIKVRPESAEAHNAEGNVLVAQGKQPQAIKCFETALKYNPDLFIARFNLGNALKAAQRFKEALENYQLGLIQNPDFWEAHNNIGTLLEILERWPEAIESFQKAIALNPDYPAALFNLGNVLKKEGRFNEALEAYQKALTLNPGHVDAQYNLGNTLEEMERFEDAIVAFEKALVLNPKMFEAHNSIGCCLIGLCRYGDAIKRFEAALAVNPENVFAWFDISACHFLSGDFEAAWHFYESRDPDKKDPQIGWWRGPKKGDWWLGSPDIVSLPWGTDIKGKSILLQGEQGLGDEIMLASMMPDVLGVAKKTILAAEPRLVGLFQRSFPGCTVVSRFGEKSPLPLPLDATYRTFMGSLGQDFRRRAADFPRKAYLIADPERHAAMKDRLDALGPGRKIGIMWRGGVGGNNEKKRSFNLSDMAPLLAKGAAKGDHWISLSHLPAAAEEVEQLFKATGIRIHHWSDVTEAKDYDETAALLTALDLVVSTTGTVAHCAGALGVEAHVLVPRVPEWRYAGHQGADMLWYETMMLYRQTDHWPLDEIANAIGVA